MIKAGIIGGAGYTAGELIRLLLNHPETEIVFINSSSNAGNKITDVHEGLYGETDLRFTDQLPLDAIDVLFFCTAHGDTKKFMESHNVPEDLKIIDLSMDYRIKSDDHDFIYGLPELNRRATCTAKHVANPGCFATCIQLGLLRIMQRYLPMIIKRIMRSFSLFILNAMKLEIFLLQPTLHREPIIYRWLSTWPMRQLHPIRAAMSMPQVTRPESCILSIRAIGAIKLP